jgi:fido (protein-threonine AMPylation protein)
MWRRVFVDFATCAPAGENLSFRAKNERTCLRYHCDKQCDISTSPRLLQRKSRQRTNFVGRQSQVREETTELAYGITMETSVPGRKRQRNDSDDTQVARATEMQQHQNESSKPTRGAISRMLRGDPFPVTCPPVVKVFPLDHASGPPLLSNGNGSGSGNVHADGNAEEEQQQLQHCMLTDDHEKVIVTCLPSGGDSSSSSEPCQSFEKGKIYVIRIKGYVVSQANVKTCEPFLFLVAWDVIRIEKQQRKGSLPSSKAHQYNQKETIQAGKAAHFLQHWAMVLSNADLAGNSSSWRKSGSSSPSTLRESHAQIVTDFLAHHAAVQTLHTQHKSPTNSTAHHDDTTTRNYLAVLASFQTSQRDRQNASLTSNAGREDAARSTLVLQQYHKAVDVALQGDALASSSSLNEFKPLTAELLCQWHGHVCGNGVHPNAGQLRQKNVRVGPSTSFGPHEQVAADLDTVLSSCENLEWRLLRQKQPAGICAGVATAVYATAVHFGVLDTHPFSDGNGRTARIATNWALQRAGLPFLVQLFATTAQKTEYRQAILQTRRNLSLVGRCGGAAAGDNDDTEVVVGEEALMAAMQSAGALSPLVDLILDRMAKAITEFQKLLKEKASLASEEAEARAARMYRERAAQGTCIICFDENPNIATLCCGKAVHLNCIAEWLSANSSCPQCRGDLPSLPQRMRPRQERRVAGVGEYFDDDDDDDDNDEEYADYVEHRADNNAIREILQDNVNQLRALLVSQGLNDETFSSDGISDSDDDSTHSSIEEDAMNEDETNVEDDPELEDGDEEDGDEEEDATVQDLRAAAPRRASVNSDDDNTIEISDDAEEEEEDDNTIEISEIDSEEEEADDDTVEYVAHLRRVAGYASESEDEDEDDDDTVEYVAHLRRAAGYASESEEEDEDDTSVNSALPMPARGGRQDLPPFCHGCRNRAAKDCSNECCGKCCVLEGSLHCDRHNC